MNQKQSLSALSTGAATICAEPVRLSGKPWEKVESQEFACKPEVDIDHQPPPPYLAIYGTRAIRLRANNMGKWGIPEKSYENVVQRC